MRKQKLRRLLCRASDASGMFAAPFDQGDIGPDLFKAACQWDLRALCRKASGLPARAGSVLGVNRRLRGGESTFMTPGGQGSLANFFYVDVITSTRLPKIA